MKYYKLSENRKLKRSQADFDQIFMDKEAENIETVEPIDLVSKDINGETVTEEDQDQEIQSILEVFDKFVIKVESRWKNVFDGILIISSVYNVFVNAFYAAFRSPT